MDSEETRVECPVCQQVVSDFEEGISDPCEHVFLIYLDSIGEIVHSSDNADEAIAEFERRYKEDDESYEDMIEEYCDDSNGTYDWLAITTSGMSCGPCSSTEYIVFNIK